MIEQFNSQILSFTKQFSETMIKNNALVVNHFEKLIDVQLKGFGTCANSMADLFEQASTLKSPEDFRAMLPKSVAMIKEGAEKNIAFGQEIAALTTSTVEQFVSMGKANFEAANDNVVKATKTASKK